MTKPAPVFGTPAQMTRLQELRDGRTLLCPRRSHYWRLLERGYIECDGYAGENGLDAQGYYLPPCRITEAGLRAIGARP